MRKKMPSRDTSGKCRGECRDRVHEGDLERQHKIDTDSLEYSTPAEKSPNWTHSRDDQPGVLGGRV